MMVSVVVPVYNVEKYLSNCVNSILSSSSNFEVILVDDGSTDKSGQICDNIALSDGRIRVFHTENSGAYAARSLGVSVALGEYIVFVDSDDTIKENSIDIIYDYLSPDLDIIVFESAYNKMINAFDFQKELLLGNYSGSVWAKVYRRDLLIASFCEISRNYVMGEDLFMNLRASLFSHNSIRCVSLSLYNYNYNYDSITKTFLRSYDYEKRYYNLLQTRFLEYINEDSNKQYIQGLVDQSFLNACRLVILDNGSINYNDSAWRNLRTKLVGVKLSLPEKICLYINNAKFARILLKAFYKFNSILNCIVRDYKK